MKTLDMKQISKILGLLLIGVFLGWLFFGGSGGEESTDMDQHIEETHTDEEGNIVYTCSMHPHVRQNEPGDCPICGMELIPVDQVEEEQEETIFTMTEAAVKLADIQTTRVERRIPELETRLPGRVAADERRVSSITAQFSGRVDELYVDFTGTYVKKGEQLAAIYSPELISAQRELLEAAKNKETDPGMYESTQRKLRLWGLPESEIQRIEASGEVTDQIPIIATQSGFVTQKNVNVRDYVNEGTVMYKVADLSRLWVLFDAYENDIGAIGQGDSVKFTVRSHPGKQFEAAVTYVDPYINPETRTARVRAEVENSDGTLKPNMLAKGIISGMGDDGEKLMVPRSAVMWTGKRSLVFVKQTDSEVPTFEARLVTLGQRAGNFYVIEEGLEEGEQVVTHGNFKLDSAAQLADKLSMMNREPGTGTGGTPSMPGMDMEDEGDMEMDHNESEDDSQQPSSSEQHSDIDKKKVPNAFKQQLNELADLYLQIKDALTEDDLEIASSKAVDLQKALSNINMSLIEEEKQMEAWMTRQKALEKHIEALDKSEDLAGFRDQFVPLSEGLNETFSTFGIDRTLYVHFCPMASNEEGGYWLSEEKEIINPYMAEIMRDCGETIQEV